MRCEMGIPGASLAEWDLAMSNKYSETVPSENEDSRLTVNPAHTSMPIPNPESSSRLCQRQWKRWYTLMKMRDKNVAFPAHQFTFPRNADRCENVVPRTHYSSNASITELSQHPWSRRFQFILKDDESEEHEV